jgi:hypothetical protein
MKLTIKPIAILLCAFIATACQNKQDNSDGALFNDIDITSVSSGKHNLSDVFTKYKVVKLQNTDDCLIGGMFIKVIKHNDEYFVRSMNEVFVFDAEGTFKRKLSHSGMGPGEYIQICDFDIAPDKNEIWVSSENGMFMYDLDTMNNTRHIALDFYANQFKCLGDDKFIAKSPDDTVFKLCDGNGKALASYFDKDLAVSGSKATDFVEIDGKVISQLENSNDAVCYDSENGTFSMVKLTTESSNIETREADDDYYNRFGWDQQFEHISQDFHSIFAFRKIGDQTLMIARHPDGTQSLIAQHKNKSSNITFFPIAKSDFINDITSNQCILTLMTLCVGTSNDSFIFLLNPSDDDANPTLLEVYEIGL